jgi:carbonic anhydrase/acetyltransferase-like protein (isoleucine patch superfamily)
MNPLRAYRGQLPQLGTRVYVDPHASVVGRVTLGDDCSVWPMAVVRGDVEEVRIGARTNVQDGVVLHVTHDGPYSPGGLPLVIGDDVTIAHKAVVHACTIGNRCLIGMGAIIMDGAVLEDEVIVGAGAVVPPGRRLPSRSVWVGNPLRELRRFGEEEAAKLSYSAAHYVRIKDGYLADG